MHDVDILAIQQLFIIGILFHTVELVKHAFINVAQRNDIGVLTFQNVVMYFAYDTKSDNCRFHTQISLYLFSILPTDNFCAVGCIKK